MFILILPRFFARSFFGFSQAKINTIYIPDIIKSAGTNMQLAAQKRENRSGLSGGQPKCIIALVCH
jgi:hypothetical protein